MVRETVPMTGYVNLNFQTTNPNHQLGLLEEKKNLKGTCVSMSNPVKQPEKKEGISSKTHAHPQIPQGLGKSTLFQPLF